jgi:hydroxypyruvate isomerase
MDTSECVNALEIPLGRKIKTMPRFAANLSMMYTESDFLDRFASAAADGFAAVECHFPYEYPAGEIKRRLDDLGLIQVLVNGPPGDWSAGDRGLASLPGREEDFRRAIGTAIDYAVALGRPLVNVMAGRTIPDIDRHHQRDVYLNNLAYAADHAGAAGVTIVIEPLNPRDMPGYFLSRHDDAFAVVTELDRPNLRVQFDVYHCQIVEGDLTTRLRRHIGHVGHLQVAGVPDRNEPDRGEVNYPYLFRLIDEIGYAGWVGCEYRPVGATSAGLGWLAEWRTSKTSGPQ